MGTKSNINNRSAVKIRDIDKYINVPKLLLEDKRKPSVYKSVYRTANILKCLSNGLNSITEIASICKLDKSTVYRLLKTLNESGLTLQDPISRLYYVGPLITEIASDPHVTHEHLVWCAVNEMKRLADVTGESVALSVLVGLQAFLLYEIRSSQDFVVSAKKKVIDYVYAGATSKILLTQLSNKDLKIAVNVLNFKPLTEHTVTDKEQLLAQLKQISHQGFALSYGEISPGALNISVPIKNYIVPAALGLLGPETRVHPKRKEFTDELIISRNRISENLKLVSRKSG